MAFETIAASETDADSPLNQTLMDKIRGNLDFLYGGNGYVSQSHLKTSTQEVSESVMGYQNTQISYAFNTSTYTTNIFLNGVSGGGANKTLSSVGQYGFYPQIKLSASTAYATIRYVQASRDEPVIWVLREISSGHIQSCVFDPECNGESHPFPDGIPDGFECLCVQLKDSDKLREHLIKNYWHEQSFLYQFNLGLWTGDIKLEGKSKPRLPEKTKDTDNLKKLGLTDKKIAPSLYRKDIKLVGLEFNN